MDDLLSLLPANLLAMSHRSSEYQLAKPFPHIYFDDFLPRSVAELAAGEFPDAQSGMWQRFERKGLEYRKLTCNDETMIPPTIRNILYALNSATFIDFLEKLTGIAHLLPDPHYLGGGLHQTLPEGQLDIHLDFNFHQRLRVFRRLNLLVYLTPDWREEYGGQFELRETKTSSPAVSLAPLFNRAALFSTSKLSWHGQPRPVACPEGMARRSIALYYYTVTPADEDDVEHRTTVFANDHKNVLRRFVPPICLDILRTIRGS
jgi:hypothetical protein